MKNVIAAAALSLVLSDFAYANEQRDEAMMKITPSTLVDADIQAVSPALARFCTPP
ncbi:putative carboxymuconolactone decarboxylase [Klebsiella variicola]|nr:putative carboxymuconolactone decarboxylase [Klebsiella variicola]